MEYGLWLAAFVVGVLGGVHCVGMCGGIVGALGAVSKVPVHAVETQRRSDRAGASATGRFPAEAGTPWKLLFGYNLGRIGSYTLAGALAGGLGALVVSGLEPLRQVLLTLGALMLVLLGLYLGQWWQGLAVLERAGSRVWRRIEPLGRRFLPIRNLRQSIVVGAVWGWLPCGLVYSVLIWSISAGSAAQGAALLLAFGLGTLPNLLLMGVFAARMQSWLRLRLVRSLAGAALVVMGLVMLVNGGAGHIMGA